MSDDIPQHIKDAAMYFGFCFLWKLISLHEQGKCATLCDCPGRV